MPDKPNDENNSILEQAASLDEVCGNYDAIFKDSTLTREQILEKLVQTAEVIQVEPLEYFENVGNGMNVEAQREEIARAIPATLTDPIERARTAIAYIKQGQHIGVSHEQYLKDLERGKDHDATMIYFLEKVLNDEPTAPSVVVRTSKAKEVFGEGIEKVILDGTHRAAAAAVTGRTLDVLEFSIE